MKRVRSKPRAPTFARSACPVAVTLDILGDKWTLLVVRDLFMGKRLYGEFAASPEAIPTNILADRLKRLETQGIVSKEPYQERPVRYAYTLTAMGRDLLPVLMEIVRWGNKHFPGTMTPPENIV